MRTWFEAEVIRIWKESGSVVETADRMHTSVKVVEEIIDFLEIQKYRKTAVGALPYGVRKRIDLGRALAQEPKVLLLDEPMAGMNVE